MRTLARTLLVLSAIPLVTGLATVAFGSAIVPGDNAAGASVESELRFFAAYWAAVGVALAWVARDLERRATELRWVLGAIFLGGTGRALAWADAGRPHELFVVLMAIELLLPPAVLAWHRRVARTA